MIKITRSRYQFLKKLPMNKVATGVNTGDVSMEERSILLGLEDFKVVENPKPEKKKCSPRK